MLLAIDCSTSWVGLALYDGAQVTGETIWQTRNHHTVELAPAVDDLLKRCGLLPTDLSAVAAALGPGSFTSLRIGLAVAKGLALALRLPVAGVPTLDILAAAQPVRDLPLAAVIQAGRGRLAVGWYAPGPRGTWAAQGEPEAMTLETLNQRIEKPTLVCGELSAEERQVLARRRKSIQLATPAQSVRRPSYLAELAWKRIQSGKTDDVVTLAPIYLRTPDGIPD